MRYIKLIFFFIIHYDCFILFSLWRKKIIKSSALKHVIIYKNTTCAIEKLSKIIINSGSLAINKPWFKKDPFPTFLTLHAGSIIDVNGIFAFYPSSRITLSYNARLSLGSGYANMGLNLCCFNKISIGNNVAISENVTIRDSDNHSIVSHAHTQTSPIHIGDHVWIGMGATILKGVTIGEGAIVAAGAVVTRNVPAHSLVAGVPARVIKTEVRWE